MIKIFLIQIYRRNSGAKMQTLTKLFASNCDAFSSLCGLDQLKNVPLYWLILKVVHFILEKNSDLYFYFSLEKGGDACRHF